MCHKILIVDDDKNIREVIMESLTRAGFIVSDFSSASEALKTQLDQFDLMIFDVMMPETDGFELCRTVREKVDCPIIMLTAKTSEQDVLYGLSLGADDYIRKPFTPRELASRVEAHLRREHRTHHATLIRGNTRFLLTAREVMVNGDVLPFTKTEYDICELLAQHPGQVFSREHLLSRVLGFESNSEPAAIAEHIKNIRKKFALHNLDPIKTVWGIGYKWEQ